MGPSLSAILNCRAEHDAEIPTNGGVKGMPWNFNYDQISFYSLGDSAIAVKWNKDYSV